MSEKIAKQYAQEINRLARNISDLVEERKAWIESLNRNGWIIYKSERQPGRKENQHPPIIKEIQEAAPTTVEIE
jgi:hypothetical protein